MFINFLIVLVIKEIISIRPFVNSAICFSSPTTDLNPFDMDSRFCFKDFPSLLNIFITLLNNPLGFNFSIMYEIPSETVLAASIIFLDTPSVLVAAKPMLDITSNISLDNSLINVIRGFNAYLTP